MKITIKDITRIGVFSALAALLYIFLRFPFPFLPSFLKINFSDVIGLISGYIFGPIIGSIIQIIKVLIKLVFQGTSTAYIGEMSDLILGVVLVFVSTLIYKRNRKFKNAVIGLIAASLIHTLIASLLNYYILIPFYVDLYGADAVLKMCVMVTNINDTGWSLILYGVIPFNLLRNLIIILITILTYKRTRKVITFLENKVRLSKKERISDDS